MDQFCCIASVPWLKGSVLHAIYWRNWRERRDAKRSISGFPKKLGKSFEIVYDLNSISRDLYPPVTPSLPLYSLHRYSAVKVIPEKEHVPKSPCLSLINFWFFVPPIFKTYLKSVLAIWKCTDFTCLSFVKTSRAGYTANDSKMFICQLHSWTEQVPLVCRWQTAPQPVIETYVWMIICGGNCIRHFCSLDLTIIW